MKKWFEECFLKSQIERLEKQKKDVENGNIKEFNGWGNRVILSDRQAEVCKRNMNYEQHHTMYGWSGLYCYETLTHSFVLNSVGKYTFLTICAK